MLRVLVLSLLSQAELRSSCFQLNLLAWEMLEEKNVRLVTGLRSLWCPCHSSIPGLGSEVAECAAFWGSVMFVPDSLTVFDIHFVEIATHLIQCGEKKGISLFFSSETVPTP